MVASVRTSAKLRNSGSFLPEVNRSQSHGTGTRMSPLAE